VGSGFGGGSPHGPRTCSNTRRSSASVPNLKRGAGKRPDAGIWPTGAQGPSFQPLTAEQQQWRQMTTTAVQASSAVQAGTRRRQAFLMRTASCPSSGSSRTASGRGGRHNAPVEETPGIEAWDSVSQAPSTASPRHDPQWDEAMSAETATQSRARLTPAGQLDHDIQQHLNRNRKGWYDWNAGRLFG